jgi:hypothetical protein
MLKIYSGNHLMMQHSTSLSDGGTPSHVLEAHYEESNTIFNYSERYNKGTGFGEYFDVPMILPSIHV